MTGVLSTTDVSILVKYTSAVKLTGTAAGTESWEEEKQLGYQRVIVLQLTGITSASGI